MTTQVLAGGHGQICRRVVWRLNAAIEAAVEALLARTLASCHERRRLLMQLLNTLVSAGWLRMRLFQLVFSDVVMTCLPRLCLALRVLQLCLYESQLSGACACMCWSGYDVFEPFLKIRNLHGA